MAIGDKKAVAMESELVAHTDDKGNPHIVTAAQTGAYSKSETDTLLANKNTSNLGYIPSDADLLTWAASQTTGGVFCASPLNTSIPESQYYVCILSIGGNEFREITACGNNGNIWRNVYVSNSVGGFSWLGWERIVTATDLNTRVSKSGDNMIGTLTMRSLNAYTEHAWQTTGIGFCDVNSIRTGWLGIGGTGTDICDFWIANDKGNISLRPIGGVAKVNDDIILHTGNKPTGSYTGNGSAADRTIQVGGIGHMALVWSGHGTAFLTENGALIISGATNEISWITANEAYYIDGYIVTKTANAVLNTNGATFNYQVL